MSLMRVEAGAAEPREIAEGRATAEILTRPHTGPRTGGGREGLKNWTGFAEFLENIERKRRDKD